MAPELGLLTPSRPGRTRGTRAPANPIDADLDAGQTPVAGQLAHPLDELRLEEPDMGRHRGLVARDHQAVAVDVDRAGACGHRVADHLGPALEDDFQPGHRGRGAEGPQGAVEDLTETGRIRASTREWTPAWRNNALLRLQHRRHAATVAPAPTSRAHTRPPRRRSPGTALTPPVRSARPRCGARARARRQQAVRQRWSATPGRLGGGSAAPGCGRGRAR